MLHTLYTVMRSSLMHALCCRSLLSGGATHGSFRYYAPRVQVSSRDTAAHTELKSKTSSTSAVCVCICMVMLECKLRCNDCNACMLYSHHHFVPRSIDLLLQLAILQPKMPPAICALSSSQLKTNTSNRLRQARFVKESFQH